LIALIASVSIEESLAKRKIKLFGCVRQQGKANVVINTRENGSIKNMIITGKPRLGKPIEFDNILIDKSRKCTELKGDFWNRSTLDSNPYTSGGYTVKEKSVKLKIGNDGNGFTLQNKGRVILYRKGDTVVGCGKLTKKKKKCKEDKAPTNAPSASPTGASTAVPTPVTTVAPVTTTGAPTASPTLEVNPPPVDTSTFCQNLNTCNLDDPGTCQISSSAPGVSSCGAGVPLGFYPDLSRCDAYCYCSGSEAPSSYSIVPTGLSWDTHAQGLSNSYLNGVWGENGAWGTNGGGAVFPSQLSFEGQQRPPQC